jgi:hypothetical protein
MGRFGETVKESRGGASALPPGILAGSAFGNEQWVRRAKQCFAHWVGGGAVTDPRPTT